ncbi:hypothetical protein HDE_03528 [Halotydeus destructor]|nr:hypothetical protein HDE_03528 [Halotydeus destructor]
MKYQILFFVVCSIAIATGDLIDDLCAGNVTAEGTKKMEQELKMQNCQDEKRDKLESWKKFRACVDDMDKRIDAYRNTKTKTLDDVKAQQCKDGKPLDARGECGALFPDDDLKTIREACEKSAAA